MPGTGTVVDAAAHRVRVSDGTELTGDALILATGSSPRSIPGFDFDGTRVLSSDHVLELDRRARPRRGHRRRRDRLRVRVVPRRRRQRGHDARGAAEHPPRRRPAGRADVVARAFKKRGIKVADRRHDHRLRRRRHALDAARAPRRRAGDLEVDRSSCSVGRRPRSEGIGLEGAGVEVDERGFVAVDGNMRTAVPRRVRGRRRRRDAAARARRRSPRRSSRSRRCSARTSAADRLRQGAVGHLLPPRGRVLRAHRGAGRERARATTSRRRCTAGAATAGRSSSARPTAW